jgi:peptidoglycan glycosyltransferase
MHEDIELLRANVIRLCRGMLAAIALVTMWLAYWHVLEAPTLRADPLNPRTRERMKLTQPGRVLTRDGKLVLEGQREQGTWFLEYPGREVYCHLTGYNAKTGLQPALHDALYAVGRYEDPWCRILRGRPTGCDVTLTVDGTAQEIATRAMANKVGAVVAMDPRDGAIRVLVSAPPYDPPMVLESPDDFALFQHHPDKPELNRALLGQYPPGSVLKVLTAAAAVDSGVAKPSDRFTCNGSTVVDGAEIRCRREKGHGRTTFEWAFADSCNVIFAEVGRGMGPTRFREYVAKFHLLDRPNLPLPAAGGRMASMIGPKADLDCAVAAFGQGATMVTPLAIAQMAATIAHGGQVPAPQLIQKITSARGRVLAQMRPEILGQAVSVDAARAVTRMMVTTVNKGTGGAAQIPGVKVAGKTGSAENPAGLPHAWFVGFAPADDPKVVVAVIVENGGAGGEVAAPIARQVMQALLNK